MESESKSWQMTIDGWIAHRKRKDLKDKLFQVRDKGNGVD
jgi:hypothetical protein